MKRVNFLWLLLDSIFLIVFNFLFFMLGDTGDAKTSVWISYGFIHFAYVLLLITPLLVRQSSTDYIYRRPLFAVTTSYFIIELVAGTIIILIAPDSIKVALIIQVILAAICIAWLVAHLIANEHTAESTERREVELQYVKVSSARLQSALQQITDKTILKKTERVYDLIHSSPIRSNIGIRSLEQQVISEIEQLENAVNKNETEQVGLIADKIYRLAEERNRQLKINNK
jgi:hypothetical protein